MARENEKRGPNISDELRQKWIAEAQKEYRDKTEKELEKELKKIENENKPSVWKWARSKIGSFFNMLKIAALSIFLGKQATASRLNRADYEQSENEMKKMVQKQIKVAILEEKLRKMKEHEQPEKAGNDKDKESEKSDPNKDTQEQDRGEEPKEPEKPDPNKEPQEQDRGEKPRGQEAQTNTKDLKRQTIFAEQVTSLTDKYRNGLATFLEAQTGISKNYIQIENKVVDGQNCIRVDFNVNHPEKSLYRDGVTLTQDGNVKENSPASKMLGTSMLYYTAKEYRESKNNTRFQGTIPSVKTIEGYIHAFDAKLKANESADYIEGKKELFGHELKFEYDKEKGASVYVDGEKLEAVSDKGIANDVRDKIRNNIEKNDYMKVEEYAKELQKITKEEGLDTYYHPRYTRDDLIEIFGKEIDKFQGMGEEKYIVPFHGHEITIESQEYSSDDNKGSTVASILVDGVLAYSMNGGGSTLTADIAERILDTLLPNLEQEGLYDFARDDEEVVENFGPEATQLNENEVENGYNPEPDERGDPNVMQELFENDYGEDR